MGFLDFFKKKQILVSTEDDKIMQNLAHPIIIGGMHKS